MEGFAEVIRSIDSFDQGLTLAINAVHSPVTDVVWKFFSSIPVWIPLYLVIIYFLFRNLGWRRGLLALGALVLTVVCCDQLANLVKNSVCRPRPCRNELVVAQGLRILERLGSQFGFFSGHACNAMGVAVGSIMCFKWDSTRNYRIYNICIVIWALLLGVSRVFVGKHYCGDVLVGFIAGAVISSIIVSVAGRCCRTLSSQTE